MSMSFLIAAVLYPFVVTGKGPWGTISTFLIEACLVAGTIILAINGK